METNCFAMKTYGPTFVLNPRHFLKFQEACVWMVGSNLFGWWLRRSKSSILYCRLARTMISSNMFGTSNVYVWVCFKVCRQLESENHWKLLHPHVASCIERFETAWVMCFQVRHLAIPCNTWQKGIQLQDFLWQGCQAELKIVNAYEWFAVDLAFICNEKNDVRDATVATL